MSSSEGSSTYAAAGVNIEKANEFVDAVKKIASQTPRTGVMGEIGGFGGLYSLKTGDYQNPVLVSSTDGVGTKLKIAFMMDKHDTVGIDLVAMCVNDVVVQGAKPLFFLDYLAMGSLDVNVGKQIVEGIAEGCRQAQCALIAGETAEMPGIYRENEYDLAGFAVGVVDNDRIIDGSEIRGGHKLVGFASSGLHSNGYSLVRKICFDTLNLKIDDYVPELGKTLGEELLTPTRIYTETLLRLLKDLPIHALAHITGGGIAENLLRVIPSACSLVLYKDSWEVPPVFKFLQDAGRVDDAEMLQTFNNGLGMVAVVPAKAAQEVVDRLAAMNEKAWIVGEVVQRRKSDKERFRWASA
ncbi:phosphoribosylformylglycinamidine cyclo-ligase [Desulfosalsimonas propionicica]|jgi:phosphoribosylformylglycinamidine cyclo-ligase|uniref:Phosphoribosylformylglycinamidine cyclo-ligase n=1 Tax=Desulfosalsimonas propionicica TaxID=332175 RepID=A0A7W0CC74_9BACT|nr:phosphoribosylformylglycinamidine cyclo-ligase [Desulfosalsimonas propionicica]MBA2883076.1 phosphoribosylformylglycinamidine cyclo-ligase [Desulfosalsimonas propionicica]